MVRRPLRSGTALLTALVVGLVFSAAGAQAVPGDLDPSFSGDGKQRTDFGFGSGATEGASGVALQPDGKIVAVGKTPGAFALARYNPNGSLDTSFSGDGKQTTSFGGGCCERANGVALQPNGKIVAVGRDEYGGWALARYNPGGSLDPSFSGDGKQTVNLCCGEANGVALQANGKIVVVGGVEDDVEPGSRAFVVARFSPNGSLDPSFAGDGIQNTDFGSSRSEANGVAARRDGKIVAVGFAGFAGNADFAIARFNPNGSFDTKFSGDGKQRTDFGGGGPDSAHAVALQPDGKVVAVGSRSVAGSAFALARYNANGSLDPSFSGDGKQLTKFGDFAFARGVALQGDGKIVVVGFRSINNQPGSRDFALVRYNPGGSLDTSFSGDGRQRTNFGPGNDEANGVALQGDGKIVAVGIGLGTDDSTDFVLARYSGG